MSLAVHPEHHHHQHHQHLRSPASRTVSSASAVNHNMRASSNATLTLEDKFEVIKEVGDGSFGSVVLARVRSRGAHIARRGTMVRLFLTYFFQPRIEDANVMVIVLDRLLSSR